MGKMDFDTFIAAHKHLQILNHTFSCHSYVHRKSMGKAYNTSLGNFASVFSNLIDNMLRKIESDTLTMF